MNSPQPARELGQLILTLRGQRVILDADLAALYGVPTEALNQAVKRNQERFPESFQFEVSAEEMESMRSQTVTASPKRNVRFLPRALADASGSELLRLRGWRRYLVGRP